MPFTLLFMRCYQLFKGYKIFPFFRLHKKMDRPCKNEEFIFILIWIYTIVAQNCEFQCPSKKKMMTMTSRHAYQKRKLHGKTYSFHRNNELTLAIPVRLYQHKILNPKAVKLLISHIQNLVCWQCSPRILNSVKRPQYNVKSTRTSSAEW